MPIYNGNTQVVGMALGDKQADKVYHGASLVFGTPQGQKITETGNPLVLQNVTKSEKLNSLQITGRTEQKAYGGYQLFDPLYFVGTSLTYSGITAIYDKTDGSWTLNGTSTEAFAIPMISQARAMPLEISNYTLTLECMSNAYFYVQVKRETGDENLCFLSNGYSSFPKTYTFNNADGSKKLRVNLRGKAGVSFSNYKVYLQLEKGSVSHSVEPYVGGVRSPSPDYPQTIENVNSVEAKQWGRNLFKIAKLSYCVPNGKYGLLANKTNNVHYCSTFIEDLRITRMVKPLGKLYFSYDTCENLVSGDNLTIVIYGEYTSNRTTSEASCAMKTGRTVCVITIPDTLITANRVELRFARSSTPSSNNLTSINGIYFGFSEPSNSFEETKDIHTATIDGIELTKWDKIEYRNGVWGVAKRSRKIDNFDGFFSQIYSDYKYYSVDHSDMAQASASGLKATCTHYPKTARSWSTWNGFGICTNYESIIIHDNNGRTLQEMNQWMNDNNVVIWYECKAETWIPLADAIQTQLNTLRTYVPTTTVSNDANCEMSAKYWCNIDTLEAQITALYNADVKELSE